MDALQKQVLAAATKPMAYPDIEAIVGEQGQFQLGIALARLVVAGSLNYSTSKLYGQEWPVYHVGKLPKRFQYPKRAELLPVAEQHQSATNAQKNPNMVRHSEMMHDAGRKGAEKSPWRKDGAAKLNLRNLGNGRS